jgi:hypothetical protein
MIASLPVSPGELEEQASPAKFLSTISGRTSSPAHVRHGNRLCWVAKVHRSCSPPVRVMKSAENRATNHDAM